MESIIRLIIILLSMNNIQTPNKVYNKTFLENKTVISEIIVTPQLTPEQIIPTTGNTPKIEQTRTESIVNPYIQYSYEKMIEDANKLSKYHPDIIKTESIGKSVERRDILLITLGKGENKIFLNGSHHAREYITTNFLMKIIDEYSKAYTNNTKFEGYDVKSMLDDYTIYVVPMVNPDGVNLVLNGINSVKNPDRVKSMTLKQNNYLIWKANINGVDLNRNYPIVWNSIKNGITKPGSEKFKGYKEGSEPETQTIMNLCKNNNFKLAMAYHTKGQVIYWADTYSNKLVPQASGIADRLSNLTGYKKQPISSNPSEYGGGFENWFRAEFKKPAFCIELTPYINGELPHPENKFDELLWNKVKTTGLFFIQEARNIK